MDWPLVTDENVSLATSVRRSLDNDGVAGFTSMTLSSLTMALMMPAGTGFVCDSRHVGTAVAVLSGCRIVVDHNRVGLSRWLDTLDGSPPETLVERIWFGFFGNAHC